MMKTYLVGGAVRDRLLGKPVKDRDWVIVGATPEQLLQLGYTAVGKDFPVFLHPQSHEEYALARTERKIGSGYHGFSCETGTHISLEQDLDNALQCEGYNELVSQISVLNHILDYAKEIDKSLYEGV